MKVLVAGGAGYIGSHTSVALMDAGHDVVIVDSLVNSQASSVEGIQETAGKKVDFVQLDIRDTGLLDTVFSEHKVDAVINFAGHKAVGESVKNPVAYYDNNLNCAISLLKSMSTHGVKKLVFSSSATVYGEPSELPIKECAEINPRNPYGRTKLYIENLLHDVALSDASWKIFILRYFNPVGAHPSGRIGESPNGVPNNLMPYISQVAVGRLPMLDIFGCDYNTPDGTGIRDYIHVMDLADGHVRALDNLEKICRHQTMTLNLGTGRGYSVLDLVRAFEAASSCRISCRIVEKREGDVAACYADPSLAKEAIDWEAKLGIAEMCRDVWNFQSRNKVKNKSNRPGLVTRQVDTEDVNVACSIINCKD